MYFFDHRFLEVSSVASAERTDYADLAMWWDLILITATKVAISYVK